LQNPEASIRLLTQAPQKLSFTKKQATGGENRSSAMVVSKWEYVMINPEKS